MAPVLDRGGVSDAGDDIRGRQSEGSRAVTRARPTDNELERRRRKAEQLAASAAQPSMDELFPAIVHAAMDGFWILDTKGRFLEVNTSYCDLIGYSRDELLAMSIPDIEATESPEETARHIEKVVREGQDRFLTKHRRKDGAIVDVEVSVQILAGRGLFFVFVRDARQLVNEAEAQRLSQEMLRQHAAERAAESDLLRTAVENSPASILVTDAQGCIQYVNPAFTRITGYSAGEALGANPRMLKSGRQSLALYRELWGTIQAGREWRGEVVNQRKDGSFYTQQLTIAPSRDAGGRVAHFVAVGQDVTERRKAEQEMLESTRALIESQQVARIGSYRTDLVAGRWTSSEVLDEIFGIVGNSVERDVAGWLSIVHPDQRAEMAAYFADEVVGARRRFDREYRILRANDGKERWVHGLGELVTDQEGRLIEMIGTIQDVTERKLLEAQFSQAQKMESVGRLAGGVAHDFNNLLTVILGEAELALSTMPTDDVMRAGLEEITKAGRRAESLTRQLLAFSRQQVVQPTTFDLSELISEADKMLRRLIGEDIALVSRPAGDLVAVRADRGQMEQVLLNLVVNARDAMPDGGELTLETGVAVLDGEYTRVRSYVKPGEYALLAVSDSGVGMTEQTRLQIFEPFFTTKERGRGTGLGLAMCYGVVKEAGGHIEVYSELGLGTTMKVYLPRALDSVDAPLSPRKELVLSGTETILVVEDDETVRELLVRMLARQGYHMLSASSGEEALRQLEGHTDPAHLLLTDVVLRGMNGRKLAELVIALHPGTKVLYMSGYTSDVTIRHRLLESGDALIQKPFTAAAMGQKVRETLDQQVPGRSG